MRRDPRVDHTYRKSLVDILETAHIVTLGLAYEKNGRLAGSAFEPILKNCDGFVDHPLTEAYERTTDAIEGTRSTTHRPL